MRLRLKYEPTVDNAPRFASDIVAATHASMAADLDYSVDVEGIAPQVALIGFRTAMAVALSAFFLASFAVVAFAADKPTESHPAADVGGE